jgi:hypothetical protein
LAATYAYVMAKHDIDPHEATGDLVLTGVHMPAERPDWIASVRWRDSGTGQEGQSSVALIARHIKHGGSVLIDDEDTRREVEVTSVDGSDALRTRGAEPGGDPLDQLPSY